MGSLKKGLCLLVGVLLAGCSGMEKSEQEKLRRLNATKESVRRQHDEYRYVIATPKQRIREKYAWEMAYVGKHSKITKEFFRCKGSSLHPPHSDPAKGTHDLDCGGFEKHSLPLREDKEFIYPILIDLLNHVQEKTGCKVVVTCGHRCPMHNTYADPSTYNQNSKHMIGAEVDFYVQGYEYQPEKVIQLLMKYYPGETFERYEKGDLNVSTPAWFNKEIFIKLYRKQEGRDFDNRHPYPYISVQVRYDREAKERVICSWQKAFNGYRRY